MATARPTLFQYIAYSYGRRLPDSMQRWVAHDLAGEGAVRRHMIRAAIPPLLVLVPFWLLPASLYVYSEMTAPIYIWTVLMSFALNKVWRRHRLAQHNLDPNLVDAIKRKKDAHIHQDYIRRYGPRPESANRQSNSSPFSPQKPHPVLAGGCEPWPRAPVGTPRLAGVQCRLTADRVQGASCRHRQTRTSQTRTDTSSNTLCGRRLHPTGSAGVAVGGRAT